MTDDEWAMCPRCLNECRAADLCEHDDVDTGPLGVDCCCEAAHPEGLKIWEAA